MLSNTPKEELERLKKWREVEEVDVKSLVKLMKMQVRLATYGAYSEKVHMREEGGKVEVKELFLQAAINGNKMIDDILYREETRLERTPEDRTINFVIQDQRLEDVVTRVTP